MLNWGFLYLNSITKIYSGKVDLNKMRWGDYSTRDGGKAICWYCSALGITCITNSHNTLQRVPEKLWLHVMVRVIGKISCMRVGWAETYFYIHNKSYRGEWTPSISMVFWHWMWWRAFWIYMNKTLVPVMERAINRSYPRTWCHLYKMMQCWW